MTASQGAPAGLLRATLDVREAGVYFNRWSVRDDGRIFGPDGDWSRLGIAAGWPTLSWKGER
jgi:hypothetical protein